MKNFRLWNSLKHQDASSQPDATDDLYFIPDLCNARAVIVLVLLIEGLVTILMLMETGLMDFSIERFGLVSLFVQWVSLISVALLCQLRRLTFHMKPLGVSILGILIVQGVTVLISLATLFFMPSYEPGIDWPWLYRNLIVAGIVAAFFMRYFYIQSQWRLREQAELRARLSALQAHIRPHFFFNSLNTVASLIVIDPEKAENMLLDLAHLFRVVLRADDQPTSMATEIELGRSYLGIECMRLGDRVNICWHLPEQIPLIQLPILTLQPLIENAIYHGIQPLEAGGEILIELKKVNNSWILEVINDCPDNDSVTRSGIAHENIQARLEAFFDQGASLKAYRKSHRYHAILTLPAQEE